MTIESAEEYVQRLKRFKQECRDRERDARERQLNAAHYTADIMHLSDAAHEKIASHVASMNTSTARAMSGD